MQQSKNIRVASLAKMVITDSSSIGAQNIQCMCDRYGFNYFDRLNGFRLYDFKVQISQRDVETIMQIYEIQDAINGLCVIENFNRNELSEILNFLCCF